MLGVKVVQVNAKQSCSGSRASLQLRVLRLGLLQDGDVGIGVFPLAEKILVRALRFGGVACHRVGTSESDMRECPQREIQDDTTMIEEFLELGSGCRAVVCHEMGLAAQVHNNGFAERERKK